MSEYRKLTAKECAERLISIKNPIVLIHARPDGDAVGSAAALCEIFRQLGQDSAVISADKIPSRLSFILEYTNTRVADSIDGRPTVSIDVASASQLGSLWENCERPLLMIDHHAVGEPFADGYIIPEASSAAEALLDIVYELTGMGRVILNQPLAYALYSAISSDTGCFSFSNARPKTHRLAAELMECGIDAADINHRLFNSKTKEQIKAEGFVAEKLSTAADGKISYAAISIAERTSLGLKEEHFDTAIDIARALIGAQIAFVIKETDFGKYKVSLRSTGADVAGIAAKFGGGGHIRAAGCTLFAKSWEEVKDKILSALQE